jgi:hypothetical protein
MCGVLVIVLLNRGLCGDSGKNKEFLFLIIKKEMKSPPSILITENPNWFQSLDEGTSCV